MTFLERSLSKGSCISASLRKTTQRLFAKAVYSFPLLSKHDPRNRITTFKKHCQQLDQFPKNPNCSEVDWYLPIRQGEVSYRELPVAVDQKQLQRFLATVRRLDQELEYHSPEVFLAAIHNAKLFSPDFLVLSKQNYIFYESAFSNEAILESSGIGTVVIRPALQQREGEYGLLGCPWAVKNYAEWLLWLLPRFSSIERFPALKELKLIVPSKLNTYQQDTLKFADISPERLVGFDGGYLQVDRLYYPELPSSMGNPSSHAVAWLRTKYLSEEIRGSKAGKRKLYITRSDATKRRVLNEAEVVDYLKAQGFEIICPGAMPFSEQVRFFSEAELVVGPHGAAFANMVFAPPSATLVEFFGDNYINGCFWALNNVCGQKHGFVIGESRWLDYSISLADLKTILAKVN